jgi:hypothetical protein
MKVLCIDAERTNNRLTNGETYTVYEEDDITFNLPVYFLEEFDTEVSKCPFDKKRFIPCSGVDETTLVNEGFEEKYYVPVNQPA